MATLRCNNCRFTADNKEWNHFKENGMTITLCPICGQEDWDELHFHCLCCGEPSAEEYCDDCKDEMKERWKEFTGKMTDEEFEMWKELYENGELEEYK